MIEKGPHKKHHAGLKTNDNLLPAVDSANRDSPVTSHLGGEAIVAQNLAEPIGNITGQDQSIELLATSGSDELALVETLVTQYRSLLLLLPHSRFEFEFELPSLIFGKREKREHGKLRKQLSALMGLILEGNSRYSEANWFRDTSNIGWYPFEDRLDIATVH